MISGGQYTSTNAPTSLGDVVDAAAYLQASRSLDNIILEKYAYLDKLPDGILPHSELLNVEREEVRDRRSLLKYAENRLTSLADHHAIVGNSLSDSWAVVPTCADLWIVEQGDRYFVESVRADSLASIAGVNGGDELVGIDGVEIATAVTVFWSKLGLDVTPRRKGYAARVLAAGRRDRDRRLDVEHPGATHQSLILPSVYKSGDSQSLLSVALVLGAATIRFNDSLGNTAIIAMMDQLLADIPSNDALTLDLRDTPSGGNTVVGRAIIGWFVDRARGYQVHNRPEEARLTGIERQWIEEVMPRLGRHRASLPKILVGRWTGSMGEGLAIGFAALGSCVQGDPMAGLNGSVEDIALGTTGISIKLPTERLMTMAGLPREDFLPHRIS